VNVLDEFQNMSPEDIKSFYEQNSGDAAIAMTHIEGDFNLGTVIRNANFFGLKEAFYIGGKRQWDRRSAVGTHNYIPLTFYKDVNEFAHTVLQAGYDLVALECNVKIPNVTIHNIFEFIWPEKSCIVVGEEQSGLPAELLLQCKYIVEIPAFGTVRSMNVGTASGIAMSSYRMQHRSRLKLTS
jgi:tRNA G18 (ribose-2'-O)-methylase SpoU